MLELPSYPSPIGKDYTRYYSAIEAFNRQLQERVRAALMYAIEETATQLAILTTGSDGRFEKGPKSLLEVTVICENQQLVRDEIKKLREVVGSNYRESIFEPSLDVKSLATDIFSYFNNDPSRVYPCRVIDGRLLYGRLSLFLLGKAKIIYEVKGKEGKYIIKKVKDRKRIAKQVTTTGMGRFKGERTYFDLETGEAYYDEDEYLLSFKVGPLRYVQTWLLKELLNYIRARSFNYGNQLLLDTPSKIPSKIHFFNYEGVINKTADERRIIIDHYLYFLWLYHISQYNSLKLGNPITEFDSKEVKKRLTDLVELIG